MKSEDINHEQQPLTNDQKTEAVRILDSISENPRSNISIAYPRGANIKSKLGANAMCQNPISDQLLRNHAYSILDVNSKNKTVTISNPHNTAAPLMASYDQFLKDFANLHVIKT